MAPIKCPKCNGTVSDTSERCAHCGFDLSAPINNTISSEATVEITDYDLLPQERRDELRDEFYSKHPQFDKITDSIHEQAVLLILSYISICVGPLALLPWLIITWDFSPQEMMMVLSIISGLAIFSIGLVLQIICRVKISKNLKASYLILKKYAKWLATEKNITMRVYFEVSDAKYKNYYDSVNVDTEVL